MLLAWRAAFDSGARGKHDKRSMMNASPTFALAYYGNYYPVRHPAAWRASFI